MIKRKMIRKIIVATSALFALLLLYLIPNEENNNQNLNLIDYYNLKMFRHFRYKNSNQTTLSIICNSYKSYNNFPSNLSKRNLNEFSLMDFCSFLRLDHVSVRHPEDALRAMDKRVKNKLRDLERKHPNALEEIECMKAEFTYLGVTPENTYMFIQGHHVMESVVMKVLTPICNALRREREEEIKRLAEHHIQFRNELTSYERRLLNIDVVLRKHTGFKASPIYKRLENDIRNFLQQVKS